MGGLIEALAGVSQAVVGPSAASAATDIHDIARAGGAVMEQVQAARRYGGRGFRGWKGRGLSAVESTPPGAAPKYPDPGQQGNDLSESQGDQTWSGEGYFPCGFPNPSITCLNFSLWRDISVWCIWGGYFGRWRSGWEGVC